MSYSQKMRSWILSGLLALVAWILWKVAQRIPTREHMEDADMSTEELILDARNRIRVLAGDRVTLEMSPYDLTKGRITYRHK